MTRHRLICTVMITDTRNRKWL